MSLISISQSLTYIFLFIALYFEVFVLVTYFENHQHIKKDSVSPVFEPKRYPTVSIIVPCWNEESTLDKTINSLLTLNYPKDKLSILIVDDGSTDNTWHAMQKFTDHPTVRIFKKENGGKHTALNFGLEQSNSELVGCLDADSYVDREALKNIILYFEQDPDAMVVTPSIKIWQPKNMIQLIQAVEYSWAIFLRKMLAFVGAMYVTPGPFSIFKREVFHSIGTYKEAHKTEDMEIAMRMQSRRMKIANCHNAFVYTSAPETLPKLYKQRLRWTYGFIQNSIDYRFMFFKRDYGNLGLFVLPIACLSILTTMYAAGTVVWSWMSRTVDEIVRIQTVGLHFPLWQFSFDWFSFNTGFITIASFAALLGMLTIVFLSRGMARDEKRFGLDLIYFLAFYSFIAPLWLGKALYNTIFSVTTNWR